MDYIKLTGLIGSLLLVGRVAHGMAAERPATVQLIPNHFFPMEEPVTPKSDVISPQGVLQERINQLVDLFAVALANAKATYAAGNVQSTGLPGIKAALQLLHQYTDFKLPMLNSLPSSWENYVPQMPSGSSSSVAAVPGVSNAQDSGLAILATSTFDDVNNGNAARMHPRDM